MTKYVQKPGYGGGPNSSIVSLNTAGVAAGTYVTGTQQHGYIAFGGDAQFVKVDFPTGGNPAAVAADLKGIDDAGDVFGTYNDATNSGLHAFARSADGTYVRLEDSKSIPTDLEASGFTISAASASGVVTGTYFSKAATHVFTADLTADGFQNFKPIELKDKDGPLIVDGSFVPQGVNDAGDVVGYYDNNGRRYGFVEYNGTTTTLTPPSVDGTDVHVTVTTGINNKDEVVGYYEDTTTQNRFQYDVYHGFNYTADGVYRTLDAGGGFRGNTRANAVNDSGQVTGTYYATDVNGIRQEVGFVLTGDDVATIDPGGRPIDINTINNRGLVGGDTYSGQLFAAVYGPDGPDSLPGGGGDVYSISPSPDPESVLEGTAPSTEFDITFTVSRSDSTNAGSVEVDLGGTATRDRHVG